MMIFLFAHGMVSVVIYAIPATGDVPFQASKSWLLKFLRVSDVTQKKLGICLGAVAALAFAGGALGVVGVPGLVGIWTWLIVAGAAISLFTLLVYFDRWLVAGVGIDVALLAAILVFQWPTNAALGL